MTYKKIFILTAAFSIALISALNVSINANESGLSNVSLDNVEALAQETSIPDCIPTKGYCYKNGMKSEYISLSR